MEMVDYAGMITQLTGNKYAYKQLHNSTQRSEVKTRKERGRDGGIHCTAGTTATLTQSLIKHFVAPVILVKNHSSSQTL